MHPFTHLLTGWAVAESADLGPKDRILVTLAAVIPDIDGLGVIAEIATKNSSTPVYWWSEYNHVLCHNVGFGLLLAVGAALLAVRRTITLLLVVLVFHLHIFADLIGSKGQDGYQWPISYLLPFSSLWQLRWVGQWVLNAWPNIMLTVVLLGVTLYLAWKRGYSPVGIVSVRADSAFVATLRRRFGEPRRPTDHTVLQLTIYLVTASACARSAPS